MLNLIFHALRIDCTILVFINPHTVYTCNLFPCYYHQVVASTKGESLYNRFKPFALVIDRLGKL